MKVACSVQSGLYEVNKKKYLDLNLSPEDTERIERVHKDSYDSLKKRNIRIPLEGNILKVKVPLRGLKTIGTKTVHELRRGDPVTVILDWCGAWEYGDFCGLAWKINLIETPNHLDPPSS